MAWKKITTPTNGEVFINLDHAQFMYQANNKTIVRMAGDKKFYTELTPEEIFESEDYYEE